MDIILDLSTYVLAFNAVLIFITVFFHLKKRLLPREETDVMEFLNRLPRDAKANDPWVLVNCQWVKTERPTKNPSPAT